MSTTVGLTVAVFCVYDVAPIGLFVTHAMLPPTLVVPLGLFVRALSYIAPITREDALTLSTAGNVAVDASVFEVVSRFAGVPTPPPFLNTITEAL